MHESSATAPPEHEREGDGAGASCWYETVSIPALLRHARTTYGTAMRQALDDIDCGDIPANGMYVLGGLARQDAALSLTHLVGQLGVSKQAAGQLVDTLVLRGYLDRVVDSDDRRRISISLTARGFAAAEAQANGRQSVDAALAAHVGTACVMEMRRALATICVMGREQGDGAEARFGGF